MGPANKGYTGKILWIDLTGKTHRTENITPEFAKKWIGGSGFAAAMMPELVSADTEPVMPEIGITEVADRHGATGKGELVSKAQNIMAIYDSVGFCKFLINGSASPNYLAQWLKYTTGIEWTVEDLMECGERIFNRKRMFNVGCGIDSKDDYLPDRAFKEKRGSGGSGDNLPPIAQMLEEYYVCRGWSQQGIPNKEVLERLKI